MVVVIGPLSGGHTHKTADRPIIPSSLTPPLNIVHRIFSLDPSSCGFTSPGHQSRTPSRLPGTPVTWTAAARRFLLHRPPLGGALWCLLPDPRPGPLVTRYVIYRQIAGPKPRTTLAASSVRSRVTSARLRLRLPSASPSAPVPAVSWSAQRQPHVFLHTLHCSRPRRPQTVAEGPWSCSRYALQDILRASTCWLAFALQLGQTPAGCWAPFGGFSRGRSSFRVAPRVLSYGPERHAWQKDRSVRSQCCARPSPACLNTQPRLLASRVSHLSATPGLCCQKCPMYFIFMRSSHLQLLL